MKFKDATNAIGNTPLIELSNLYEGPGQLFAKMEFMNPGGSVKDRIALRILRDAYKNGELKKGQPVVEMTSGNTGAGLAVVCNVFGNPFIAVMSEGQSPERAKMLKSLGATVRLVPQVDGQPGKVTGGDIKAAVELAKKVAVDEGAFYVDQFNRPGGVTAHAEGTGPEIWADTEGKIDAFVACVGSGGTLIGVSKFLKEKDPSIYCAAVEPKGSEVLAGGDTSKPKHILQGTGYGLIPPHWEKGLIDDYHAVSDADALKYTKLLAHKEGLHVGYSAGANVCAAIHLLNSGKLKDGATVVTVLCDTGFKYNTN